MVEAERPVRRLCTVQVRDDDGSHKHGDGGCGQKG